METIAMFTKLSEVNVKLANQLSEDMKHEDPELTQAELKFIEEEILPPMKEITEGAKQLSKQFSYLLD